MYLSLKYTKYLKKSNVVAATLDFNERMLSMTVQTLNKAKPLLSPLNSSLPDPKMEVEFGPFTVNGHKIYIDSENKKGEPEKVYVSELIWIDRIRQNVEKGSIELDIIYRYRDMYYITTVSREVFNERGLQVLTKLGADVHKNNQNYIAGFLRIQEKMVEKFQYQHHSLGWDKELLVNENQLEYYLSDRYVKNPTNDSNKSSKYSGNFKMTPKGTYENWLAAINEHVVGHTPLEVAMVLGFSAVINSMLQSFLSLEVLLVHIYGESSTGKSTASKLAISAFGKPDHGGLFATWNSTNNSVFQSLANIHGTPIVFDETSIKSNTDFSSIIYQIAMGEEKKRLTADITFRDSASWSGTVILTGEHQVTESANKNTGIRVRLLELYLPSWTKSAEHANTLGAAIAENYGNAGVKFVQHVIQHVDKETIVQRFESWLKKLVDVMDEKDVFSERVSKKYAVILLTAEVMNECFPFTLDLLAIEDFLMKQEREMIETRSLEGKAWSMLQQRIIQHQAKFQNKNEMPKGTEFYGTIRERVDYLEVAVVKSICDQWLKEEKYSSVQVIVKKLKEKGYLDHEQGKNTRKRKIENLDTGESQLNTMYIFKMPKGLISEKEIPASPFDTKHRPIKKRSILPKIKNQSLDEMLEESEIE